MMVLMHHMPWSKWILCFKGPVDVMWRGTTVVMILKLRLNPINQCWDDLNHVACMVTSLIFYPYPSLDWDVIDVNCTLNFQGEGWAKSFGQRNKLDQKCDPGERRSISEQKLKFLFIPWVLCAGTHALGIAPSVRACEPRLGDRTFSRGRLRMPRSKPKAQNSSEGTSVSSGSS